MFLCIYYGPVSDSWHRLSLFFISLFPPFLCIRRTKKFYEVPGSPNDLDPYAWLSSLMIGVYCSPARISSHLNYRCNHRGKERRRVKVSTGRQARQLVDRDKLCFDFFCMEEKAFEKSNGWDCCLQKRKRSCESRVPAAVVHLFSDYTITTILYYIHQMGSTRKKKQKKSCSNSNARLPCLPCSSFRPYPMPGFPRERGLGKQGCRQDTAFSTNKARHV